MISLFNMMLTCTFSAYRQQTASYYVQLKNNVNIKTENNMNYKLFVPLVAIVCLLFTACDKDDVLPGEPMLLTHEILTPESVKYEGGSVDWVPKYYFKANGNEV